MRAISASNVENLVSNVAIDVVEFCVSMAYLLAAVDPDGVFPCKASDTDVISFMKLNCNCNSSVVPILVEFDVMTYGLFPLLDGS